MIVSFPITPPTAAWSEKLCDAMAEHGYGARCFALAVNYGASDEVVGRFIVSAEAAFGAGAVEVVPVRQGGHVNPQNMVFATAAAEVEARFKHPWLWLEPWTVALRPLGVLFGEYAQQPRRYLGRKVRDVQTGAEYIHRVAVYPPDAGRELSALLSGVEPFEVARGVSGAVGLTKLIQVARIESEGALESVRPESVVVCGDTAGLLLDRELAREPKVKKRISAAERIRALAKEEGT
jgi:hypothetical protein